MILALVKFALAGFFVSLPMREDLASTAASYCFYYVVPPSGTYIGNCRVSPVLLIPRQNCFDIVLLALAQGFLVYFMIISPHTT